MSAQLAGGSQSAGKGLSIAAVHGNGGGAFRFSRLHRYLPDDVNLQAITLPGFADVPDDGAT